MSSNYFESSVGRVYYDKRGLGPPLVLVHGIYVGASGEEFSHNVSTLQRHFTVYNVDLLGFGSSDAPRLTHTAELHQHLLRSFIVEVIGERVCLVVSGQTAGIAVRLGVYDDATLSKLVLIAPVLDPVSSPPFNFAGVNAALIAQSRLPLGNQFSQFVMSTLSAGKPLYDVVSSVTSMRDFLNTRYAHKSIVVNQQAERLHYWANQPNGMYAFISLLNGYFDVDVARWLRNVRVPTLIVWGEAMGEAPKERLLRPAAWSQGKELVVVPGTKHWPHDERSADVNGMLERWLLNGANPSFAPLRASVSVPTV